LVTFGLRKYIRQAKGNLLKKIISSFRSGLSERQAAFFIDIYDDLKAAAITKGSVSKDDIFPAFRAIGSRFYK